MKKILIADFSKGNEKAYVRGLYQHDYGAILKVTGIEYAEIIRVDFAGTNDEKAHPVVALQEPDGGFCVKIPKENTDKAGELSAYIYVTDAEAGFTIKEVILPIIKRIEADPDPSGEKTDPFAEAIEEIKKNAKAAGDSAASAAESEKTASESATQAEKSAVKSQKSAEAAAASEQAAATSATAAAESASQARESAAIARSAADQAAKSATAAAESETTAAQQAQNAAQSATNASGSAESAAQSAETAKTAADAAGKSASSAQQASRSATESASTATAAAQTATTAAGKAAESATLAGQSAGMASQKATAAETSAGNAAESATEAGKSATAAGDSASAAKTSETAAEEAAQTAQEQAEKIKASAEQIEKNKTDVTSLKEEIANVNSLQNDIISLKADKTSLATTDRKLDALWKLNQGISYEFQTDDTEAYQKTVPSGAKVASIRSIGGKTIVWNQLLNYDTLESGLNRWYDVSNDDGIYTLIAKNIGNRVQQIIQVKSNHIYLMKAVTNESSGNSAEFCPHSYGNQMTSMAQCYNKGEGWKKIYQIIKAGYTGRLLFQFYLKATEYPATMQYKSGSFQVFDLTQMFGSGNEPSTVEEFEAMFPEESYSYNVGELLSASVSEVVEQGKNLYYGLEMLAVGNDSYEYIEMGYNAKAIQLKPNTVYAVKFTSVKTSNIILLINSTSQVNGNKYVDFRKLTDEGVYTTDADGKLYVGVAGSKTKAEVIARLEECNIQIEESSVATAYSPYRRNTYPVPETVQQLPGYGWNTGDAYNYVDFEEKKYHKKVEKFYFNKLKYHGQEPGTKTGWNSENTLGLYAYWNDSNTSDNYHAAAGPCSNNFAVTSANAIHARDSTENCVYAATGYLCVRITRSWAETTLKITESSSLAELIRAVTDFFNVNNYVGYFELTDEEVTDISDLIGNTFQEPFEVEAGGTLTFQNSHGDDYRIPVSSTEEYLVSLAEVAK